MGTLARLAVAKLELLGEMVTVRLTGDLRCDSLSILLLRRRRRNMCAMSGHLPIGDAIGKTVSGRRGGLRHPVTLGLAGHARRIVRRLLIRLTLRGLIPVKNVVSTENSG